ncbi:MAG: hypothetical protein P0Y58_20985 [Candidatus Pseudomonas phytovorans]|uniref:Uncharacterized protein n=1 Tax=Candidatus Pseudomonas phytovorans TaxID=3121377 RepID=A0AAJ6BC80_9PSED|nr:hypothetical protein [Pseudomonas sp.]WEK29361.1 MAG: hypothetical protein P0Y58_20985 [Pseudomonas sp.]
MKRTLPLLFACAVFPLQAWSALEVGEFTLGMPKSQALAILQQQFGELEHFTGYHYQVPTEFYQGAKPKGDYNLGGIAISQVKAVFNEADQLRQVEVQLDTTDEARVQQLLPMTKDARPVPDSGRLEAFSADGELVYWVSKDWDWTVVTIADKASSVDNIKARAESDKKFAQLNRKFDKLIETVKAVEGKKVP